jgi:GTP cyclohydrolase I
MQRLNLMKKKVPTFYKSSCSFEQFQTAATQIIYAAEGYDDSLENGVRGGLQETPARFAKAWEFYTSGYNKDPAEILKSFEDGAKDYEEMVIVKDIPFYSHCEHHLAPIFGNATVAYIPDGRIVGLSKLSRLVDIFARRLQVQERMTVQIADALNHNLEPKGCGVVVKARHMCMEARGICQQGHLTVTSAFRGILYHDFNARAEFYRLASNEHS